MYGLYMCMYIYECLCLCMSTRFASCYMFISDYERRNTGVWCKDADMLLTHFFSINKWYKKKIRIGYINTHPQPPSCTLPGTTGRHHNKNLGRAECWHACELRCVSPHPHPEGNCGNEIPVIYYYRPVKNCYIIYIVYDLTTRWSGEVTK